MSTARKRPVTPLTAWFREQHHDHTDHIDTDTAAWLDHLDRWYLVTDALIKHTVKRYGVSAEQVTATPNQGTYDRSAEQVKTDTRRGYPVTVTDVSTLTIPERGQDISAVQSIAVSNEQGEQERPKRTPTEKQRTSPKVHKVYDPNAPIPRNGHRIPSDSGLPFGGKVFGKIDLTDVERINRDRETARAFETLRTPVRTIAVNTSPLTAQRYTDGTVIPVEQITAHQVNADTAARIAQMNDAFHQQYRQFLFLEGYTDEP